MLSEPLLPRRFWLWEEEEEESGGGKENPG